MSPSRTTLALLIAGMLASFSCGDCIEAPVVSGISPSSAAAGSHQLTVVVTGNNFRSNSTVEWNGEARQTVFITGKQLQVVVTASDLANPTVAHITVETPPKTSPVTFTGSGSSSTTATTKTVNCAGGVSSASEFTVTE